MGFIFEIDEPLFRLPVDVDRNDDRAGVDLVGLLLVVKLSFLLELLRGEYRKVHQADELVASARVQRVAVSQVLLEGVLDRLFHVAFAERDLFELGLEGRVAAVVRPVGVEHADLGDRGVALLFIFEIIADKNEIRIRHRQIQRIVEGFELLFRHFTEALKDLHILRLRIVGHERLRLHLIGRAGVHRIHAVVFDLLDVRVGQLSEHHVGGGGADGGLFIFIEETDTLLRRVSPLVELAGQVLYGEYAVRRLRLRQRLRVHIVDRRLRKDGLHSFFPGLVRDIFNIVADKDPDIVDIGEAKVVSRLVAKLLRLDGKCFFLLYIYSSYHLSSPLRRDGCLSPQSYFEERILSNYFRTKRGPCLHRVLVLMRL